MGRQLDRQGLERGQHLEPDVLAGEHVVAAASANEVDQRDKVGRTCSPTMRRCGQTGVATGCSFLLYIRSGYPHCFSS
jgi:hypothetical protein